MGFVRALILKKIKNGPKGPRAITEEPQYRVFVFDTLRFYVGAHGEITAHNFFWEHRTKEIVLDYGFPT
jgi:hypothetical protein